MSPLRIAVLFLLALALGTADTGIEGEWSGRLREQTLWKAETPGTSTSATWQS